MKAGRFFFMPDGGPYFNMAFDEWLFAGLGEGRFDCDALLRLYSWKPTAITIGSNQQFSKAVDKSLLDRKIPVIKRITGGRAIYHDESEITFSLIIGLDLMPDRLRSLSATNRLISETLVKVFRAKGIDSAWEKKSSETRPKTNRRFDKTACFNSVSRYELTSGLSKIVGGAQRRRGDFMIHQGALKINGITPCRAIGQPGEPAPGRRFYAIDDLADIFAAEFSESLEVDFKRSELTVSERNNFDIFFKNYRKNR
jgi:lipoate-protein ligase A